MKDYSLNEEARVIEEFTCRFCGDHVTGYAALDPVQINGYFFCDHCANDFVALRMEYFIDQVSDKTKRLVKAVDDENYHKIWQREFDKSNRVNHI